MRKRLFLIPYILLYFGIAHTAVAQKGTGTIDSLKNELIKAPTDSLREKILMGLYGNTDCDGMSAKLGYLGEYNKVITRMGWHDRIFKVLQLMGDTYLDCAKDLKTSIFWFDSARRRASVMGNKPQEAKDMEYIAQAYETFSDHAAAIDYYNRAAETDRDPKLVIIVYGNIGNVYANIGDYPKAESYYEKAYNIQHQQLVGDKTHNGDDTLTLIGLLISISDMDILMGQPDKALDNYRRVQELNQIIKENKVDLYILIGTGKCFRLKKDYEHAIQSYQSALATGKKIAGYKFHDEAGILNEIANCYLESGNPVKAKEFAQQSLEIMEGKTAPAKIVVRIPVPAITLGKIYTQLGDNNKAAAYLRQAITMCEKTGAIDDEKEAWLALSNTYAQMNKKGDALEAYKKYIVLRDSVFNKDKAMQMTRMEMQGEYGRKQFTDSVHNADNRQIAALQLTRQKSYTYMGIAGALALLVFSFFMLRNNKLIEKEKKRSDDLLLNILPATVAEELKTNGYSEAQFIDHASVLFTDFKDFTTLSEKLPPKVLIAEINECFSEFDRIMQRYGVEKIKTIGDSYMAAGGIPTPNTTHPVDVVNAALDIQKYILQQQAARQAAGKPYFQIRIGVHTGPVIAGIVGLKKFAYDIWGDTVNTANRMELTAETGKVNISQTTYELVKDKFTCTYRGEIEAKNKGKMKMYYVEHKHQVSSDGERKIIRVIME